jgi:hypothetical protein
MPSVLRLAENFISRCNFFSILSKTLAHLHLVNKFRWASLSIWFTHDILPAFIPFCLDFNFRITPCIWFFPTDIIFFEKSDIKQSLSKLLCYQFLDVKNSFISYFLITLKTVCFIMKKKECSVCCVQLRLQILNGFVYKSPMTHIRVWEFITVGSKHKSTQWQTRYKASLSIKLKLAWTNNICSSFNHIIIGFSLESDFAVSFVVKMRNWNSFLFNRCLC